MSNHWTTGELRRLRAAYESGVTGKELAALFPRHSPDSVRSTCSNHDISTSIHLRWLRLAHEYFARCETGLLA